MSLSALVFLPVNYPVGPFTARITEPILRGSICADFVGGVEDALLCCKGSAGLVIDAIAIIPQADKTVRVLLAEGFCVVNRFLDFNSRLSWFVNGITSLPAQRRLKQLSANIPQLNANVMRRKSRRFFNSH